MLNDNANVIFLFFLNPLRKENFVNSYFSNYRQSSNGSDAEVSSIKPNFLRLLVNMHLIIHPWLSLKCLLHLIISLHLDLSLLFCKLRQACSCLFQPMETVGKFEILWSEPSFICEIVGV